jgi:hypothetical protein
MADGGLRGWCVWPSWWVPAIGTRLGSHAHDKAARLTRAFEAGA